MALANRAMVTVCLLCVAVISVSLFLIRALRILVYRGRNFLPLSVFILPCWTYKQFSLDLTNFWWLNASFFFVCVYMHSGFWRTKAYAANMLFWPIRAIRCSQDNQVAYFLFHSIILAVILVDSSVVPRYPGRCLVSLWQLMKSSKKILSRFPLKMLLLPFTT